MGIRVRSPRHRIFDITVNGLKCWREDARGRVALEVQHDLATSPERFKGQSVRVVEKYIGGAKPSLKMEDEDAS